MNRKILAQAIFARLKRDPIWGEISAMTKGLCRDYMIVGGKVYRNALELVHGGDFAANGADWDMLCMDMTNQPINFPGWFKARGPGSTVNNYSKFKVSGKGVSDRYNKTAKNVGTLSCKFVKLDQPYQSWGPDSPSLDLICLEEMAAGLGKPNRVATYMDDVPLTIQALGIDIANMTLVGHGFDDIFTRKTSLNNEKCLTILGGDVKTYAVAKAASAKVEFIERKRSDGTACLCSGCDLLMGPCKCGWLEKRNDRNGHSGTHAYARANSDGCPF